MRDYCSVQSRFFCCSLFIGQQMYCFIRSKELQDFSETLLSNFTWLTESVLWFLFLSDTFTTCAPVIVLFLYSLFTLGFWVRKYISGVANLTTFDFLRQRVMASSCMRRHSWARRALRKTSSAAGMNQRANAALAGCAASPLPWWPCECVSAQRRGLCFWQVDGWCFCTTIKSIWKALDQMPEFQQSLLPVPIWSCLNIRLVFSVGNFFPHDFILSMDFHE